MVIAFLAGWILGSVSLYSYMVLTAREPPHEECMDCRESECGNCPLVVPHEENFRLAA